MRRGGGGKRGGGVGGGGGKRGGRGCEGGVNEDERGEGEDAGGVRWWGERVG